LDVANDAQPRPAPARKGLGTKVDTKITLKVVQAHFPAIPRTYVAAYYAGWRAERRGDDTGPDEVML